MVSSTFGVVVIMLLWQDTEILTVHCCGVVLDKMLEIVTCTIVVAEYCLCGCKNGLEI